MLLLSIVIVRVIAFQLCFRKKKSGLFTYRTLFGLFLLFWNRASLMRLFKMLRASGVITQFNPGIYNELIVSIFYSTL